MLLGLALLGTTLWILLDETMLSPVAADMDGYNHVLYFLMVIAGIMTIMGFLGCCGAMQESQCMLATFFTLVCILFIGQVAVGVWLYRHGDQFQKVVETSVASSIQYDYGFNEGKTKAFDIMQKQLMCCGASGPSDWAESRYNDVDSKSALEVGVGKLAGLYKVPQSCCKHGMSDSACESARSLSLTAILSDTIYSEGCASKMMKFIQKHDYIALGVILAVLFTEIMAMVFSMVLFCAVRRIDHFKA